VGPRHEVKSTPPGPRGLFFFFAYPTRSRNPRCHVNGLSTCRVRALQTLLITWPPVQLIVMAPNRGGYFKCPSCSESFGSQGAMNSVLAFLPLPRLVLLISPHQHFSTRHRHRFECSNCGREFNSASARDTVRPFRWSPAWVLTISFSALQHGPSPDKVPRV